MKRLDKRQFAKALLDALPLDSLAERFAEQGVVSVTALSATNGLSILLNVKTESEGVRGFEVRVREVQ